MCQALKSIYSNVQHSVRINKCKSALFHLQSGFKQGCKISPILFNLYMKEMLKELDKDQCGVRTEGANVSNLLYADNVILLSGSPKGLQTMLDILQL